MTEDKSKEEMILDVAKRVIEKRGFHNTRMEDIADDAGVAKGTLYLYFKSKEELFARLMDREYSKILKSLLEIVNSSDDVVSKIGTLIESFIRYMEKNRGFFLSIMYGAHSAKKGCMKEKMMEKTKMIYESMKGLVEEGIREGIIRDDIEVSVIVATILGTLTESVFHAINFERDRSLFNYKDSILKVVFSGILKEKGGILW